MNQQNAGVDDMMVSQNHTTNSTEEIPDSSKTDPTSRPFSHSFSHLASLRNSPELVNAEINLEEEFAKSNIFMESLFDLLTTVHNEVVENRQLESSKIEKTVGTYSKISPLRK